MANLVSPGYSKSVLINQTLKPIEERIIEFRGLNRQRVVEEGEMSDMLNLTSDNYPLLTPRKARGVMEKPPGVIRPIQIMTKSDRIAMIARTNTRSATTAFYYDGTLVASVTGLSEASRMVSINTKICFFPEKKYITIAPDGTVGEAGNLEASETLEAAAAVTITNDDARVALAKGLFKYDDAINIKGKLNYTPSGGTATEIDFEASTTVLNVIEGGENDTTDTVILPSETFIEVIGAGVSTASLTTNTKITRDVPDIDHVIEWNNRLWGANSEDNTIYACKLGDPTNWQYFQGTSLDSYYAQQGSEGSWTGSAVYSNHLIFFKENSMCRIYGSAPSNFQAANTEAFGVESGSNRSVVTINDTVYYKSKVGIMAYSGGMPVCISDKLHTEFIDVVAGTEKRKYYASIKTEHGYELMVFDTEKGVWHKEDGTRFRSCATIGDKLYYLEYMDDLLACSVNVKCSKWLTVGSADVEGDIRIVNPDTPTEDATTMDWMAVFGPFDEYIEEHKIYSKLAMRIIANEGGNNYLCDENEDEIMTEEGELIEIPRWLRVYISIEDGPWELVENYEPPQTKGDFIPIIPRRCDRYSVKVEGRGPYAIKTLTRRVRKGSFGRL